MRRQWSKKLAFVMVSLLLAFGTAGCLNSVKMVKDIVKTTEYETKANALNEEYDAGDLMKDSDVIAKDTNEKLESIEELIDDNF